MLNLGGILLLFDLRDGSINSLVVLQLDDDGWRIHVFARNEHQVGETLARGQLAVDDIVVGCVEISNAQHSSQ